MIDTVRISALNNELGVVQDTIERAQERRHAIVRELVGLLNESAAEGADGTSPEAEQPTAGQGAPPASPSSATVPAAVSPPPGDGSPATSLTVVCPECQEQLKPQGIGTHRRIKHGVTGRAASEPARLMSACPECGKEVKTVGMGTHRRQAHGRGRQTVLVKPEVVHARESFLCGNNCGRSFPTKDRLNLHETSGTCQPTQTRPPTDRAFRINGSARPMSGDGFGQ